MLNTAWLMLKTELTLHWRSMQEWLYPLAFFVIVISLFPLALTPDPALLQKLVPGCIWMAALLSSLLSVENIFLNELEDGHLEQMLLSQTPLSVLLLGKLAAQWLVTQLPLVLITPLLGVVFHLDHNAILALCLGLLAGTPVLTLIGSFGVALTLGLRQQGALLGLLILPLVIPVLIFGVAIVQQSQAGLSFYAPLAFLSGLSLLAMTLVPCAIAGVLRVGVDD